MLERGGAQGALAVGTLGLLAMKKLVVVAAAVVLALAWAIAPWIAGVAPPDSDVAEPAAAVQAGKEEEASVGPAQPATTRRLAVRSPPGGKPASLRVRVRWPDGSPAAGVAVRVQPVADSGYLRQRTADASPDGIAVFEDLIPATLHVTADRGGEAELRLSAGEAAETELRIPPGLEVRGTVLDRDRHAIGGAAVWLSASAHALEGASRK